MLSVLLHANYFYIYLVPLLVHRIGNLIAFVAALFLASDGELASARGADARSRDSISWSQDRIRHSKNFVFQAVFFFTFSDLFYRVFLLL